MEDRIQLFNNQVKGKKFYDWDRIDYDNPPAGLLCLDKKVKEMLLMNDGFMDVRKLGRKIIPVIMSSR